ncbi:MAG TPA: ABC transporter ATP-binding protein [Candidatus Ventricola gallistercoris]|nr:ABC transporter ATP-binding protein [Candidatus Ventricola gallistercoris]
MRKYSRKIACSMVIKLLGTVTELMIPYILAHLIDEVVPLGCMELVILWGSLMVLTALLTRQLNVCANRIAIDNAHNVSYDIRQALFTKTANLSGSQFDAFGLPSLISRMTSDSYNIQSCVQALQTLCVRMPMMLLGGIAVTLAMDPVLSSILCVIVPVLIVVILGVSRYGIPLYRRVQERLDEVVRTMREDIDGIRVVKALSKTEYEKNRFARNNDAMTRADIKASTIMAIPGPLMQMCLNIGLTLVVLVGAMRVNSGQIKPGVILAFLTYFNMVMQGVLGINRIFMMISKATASASRLSQVLSVEPDQRVLSLSEAKKPSGDEYIRFEHVNFRYSAQDDQPEGTAKRDQCLYDISFALRRGESLGIIGPTGCGKTTIVNLLMRFYDVTDGGVFVDGRDVRTYEKDELHRKFGVVFQNDMVFYNTLRENIRFGRNLDEAALMQAVEDAVAAEYIGSLEEGLDYQADIKGANLSGGQKQRLLISRALAGNPDILILDDSSSALDYKTDAALRKAIFERHRTSTTIMIAQRVSSIQSMTHILVMDNGRCIGYGTHEELLKTCPSYLYTYRSQMGALS